MAASLKIFVLCSMVILTQELPIATVKTIEKATKMLEFAIGVNDVVDIITGRSSDSGQLNHAQLLDDLKAHIDGARIEILSSIILRSKLDRVIDAVEAVQSSLVDLKDVLEAETGADELLNLFKERYAEHDVIKHVRFLKTLLTFKNPGENVNLITLVREGTRCGAADFNRFRTFYLDLIVDGALLDIIYLKLTTQTVNIQTFIYGWANTILDADAIFAAQIPICDERFPSDVQTDLMINEDPSTLGTELEQRYPERNFDVLYYSGYGTNQFHSFRYSNVKRNFFWDRNLDSRNKVVVLIEDNGRPMWNKASTKSKLKTCLEGVSVDPEDDRAAEHVLTAVSLCDGLTYPIGTAIVYFESDDFPIIAVTPYRDSPVVELEKEGVTLKYCFKSGFLCTFSGEESSGRFRIMVYPNLHSDVTESDYVIAGSRGLHSQIWCWTLFVLLGVYRTVF